MVMLKVCIRRAHPHVCGEHQGDNVYVQVDKGSSPRMRGTLPAGGANQVGVGSSPRMRGTLTVLTAQKRGVGLIPTYAGNTQEPA